jgi:mannose-6-phosphate isomerase-like protein (cupin superfamily)
LDRQPLGMVGAMAAPYTHKSLTEVKDAAPDFGYGELQEARFAGGAFDAEETGFSHIRVKPGKRQGFAHRHDEAEEVYVVLSGSGRVKLDDDIIELTALDALRVSPGVTRQFEGGPDGIELLAFGPRHEGDGEILPGWWSD